MAAYAPRIIQRGIERQGKYVTCAEQSYAKRHAIMGSIRCFQDLVVINRSANKKPASRAVLLDLWFDLDYADNIQLCIKYFQNPWSVEVFSID